MILVIMAILIIMGMVTPIIMGMAFILECRSDSDTAEVGTAAVTITMAAAVGTVVAAVGTEAGAAGMVAAAAAFMAAGAGIVDTANPV